MPNSKSRKGGTIWNQLLDKSRVHLNLKGFLVGTSMDRSPQGVTVSHNANA